MRLTRDPALFFIFLGLLMASPLLFVHAQEPNQPMVYENTVGGPRIIEEGQPLVMIHATVEDVKRAHEADARARTKTGAATPNQRPDLPRRHRRHRCRDGPQDLSGAVGLTVEQQRPQRRVDHSTELLQWGRRQLVVE